MLRQIATPTRSVLLLGLAVILFVLVGLRRSKPGPIVQDASAVAPRPVAMPCSDLRICAVPLGTAPASEAQTYEAGGRADVAPVDAWLMASPQRAWLMSPEAMAGYEPILTALDLSSDRLHRAKMLIVERAESASDAEQLGKEQRLRPEQTLFLRIQAEAAFDRELEVVVGTSNSQIVREMLQLTPQLAEIANSLGRKLAQSGIPLSAAQTLQLAQFYREAYSANSASPPVDRWDGFDAQSGLGLADRQLLSRASALLTPDQLDTVRVGLAKTTTTYAIQP